MAETTGNTSLFPVFALSILSLVLLPWTIYKCCYASAADAAKIWETADKKNNNLQKIRSFLTFGNVALVSLWLISVLLVIYIQRTQSDHAPFDPFGILEVTPSATPSEIKKAYFRLSLRYHPDKVHPDRILGKTVGVFVQSSDPKDHKYFAEFVSKAYQALTDPVSKANYEKHGHPDGPQGMDLGIALPEWLFIKDPRALLVLVFVFILLPLSMMAWYLFRSDQYTGPNSIMHETLANYTWSKYGVKESQGIVRIPETLVRAKEFITMYTPNEHFPALDELRKLVRSFHPELKEKPQFWKRRSSVLKAHMLLYAHLERAHEEIPSMFNNNLNFVLEKSIPLLQEMFKVACQPRRPNGHGWLTPAVAIIQTMQCITQAVPLSVRRSQLNKKDMSEGYAALLQLPGMDSTVTRHLSKKRIRTIQDLMDMSEAEGAKLLEELDFDASMQQDVDTTIQALPTVDLSAKIFVEDEEEIQCGDIVTCRMHLTLTRKSHERGNMSDADLKGGGVLCFSPHYPFDRPEKWYIMVMLPKENRVIHWTHVVLKEAEIAGLSKEPVEDEEERGQVIDLQFPALLEGSFDLHVGCYSDCWIGCDKVYPLKLVVKKATKIRSITKLIARNAEEEAEMLSNETGSEEEEEEERQAAKDVEDDEYDSEETGELETGTDEDEQDLQESTEVEEHHSD